MTNLHEATIRTVCDHLAHLDPARTWLQRLAAATLILRTLLDVPVDVVPVRAALYSRSAVYRLGGCALPAHAGEVSHFREQVGPAMVLLGVERPHAVLAVGSTMIELADARAWHDRGVLLRPFVADRPRDSAAWIASGLRYGVSVAYERSNLVFEFTPDLVAHRLARDVLNDLKGECAASQQRHAT